MLIPFAYRERIQKILNLKVCVIKGNENGSKGNEQDE